MGEKQVRNFCILAHIDHGKSTLSDRFLELTNTIPKEKMRPQYLDAMDLERGKGITIKMHPVRMLYEHPQNQNSKPPEAIPSGCNGVGKGQNYILNLIDTPGHVDFSYEVSRSLAAVEGAILLVDATQGVQAQTLANLELAKKQNIIIIPAVNKIDSPQARIGETKEELSNLLVVPQDEIFEVSAKNGTNCEKLLQAVIEKVPSPAGSPDESFETPARALIFDSKYDSFKGVIAYIRVFNGQFRRGEKIYLMAAKTFGEIKEIGYFKPELRPVEELQNGEIGYVATGIKEPGRVRVGDTITKMSNVKTQMSNLEPLAGYHEPKPMVFASVFPENSEEFDLLKTALSKLKLNDAAFTFEAEMKEFLGRGFQCGFLGTLHAEIVSERLRREFNLGLIISPPSVVYRIINTKNQQISIYSPSDWPDEVNIKEILEPWVKLEIVAPLGYIGQVSELLKASKGNYIKTEYIGKDKPLLFYEIPLREIIFGFYDNLKSVSQGFASMNYEILSWRSADLLKLDILIAGKKEEAFSKIVSKESVFEEGKKIVSKLKEILPPQLFAVALQAAISGKIIARETIKAKRRDVIAPLYGGDYTRKRKLLEKQKKGKKELREKGEIKIPPRVFLEMFKG